MKLLPLAMRVPNRDGIYAPSKLESEKKLSISEFEKYSGVEVKVSFDRDGISNPQTMTAYGFGLDCWYLARFE